LFADLLGARIRTAADAEIDGILAAADADDNCTLARAWRRRGYIRFEQQRWDEARAAYERSLEYQPGNELALTELELISQQIGPSDPLSPALTTQTFVTECNNSE
jgi:tetratricopeptide (TPR) repeat protein